MSININPAGSFSQPSKWICHLVTAAQKRCQLCSFALPLFDSLSARRLFCSSALRRLFRSSTLHWLFRSSTLPQIRPSSCQPINSHLSSVNQPIDSSTSTCWHHTPSHSHIAFLYSLPSFQKHTTIIKWFNIHKVRRQSGWCNWCNYWNDYNLLLVRFLVALFVRSLVTLFVGFFIATLVVSTKL